MDMAHIISIADPFVDSETGTYYILVPVPSENGAITLHEVEHASRDAQAWLENILTEMYGRQTKGTETKKAMEVLRGAALERPRRKARTPAPKQVDPLPPLGQVVDYIAEHGGAIAENGQLLSKVTSIARKLGLLANAKDFPTNVDQLGIQLRDLVKPLALRGVKLERHDTARPRKWTIHPKDLAADAGRESHHREVTSGDAGVREVSSGPELLTRAYGPKDTSEAPTLPPKG